MRIKEGKRKIDRMTNTSWPFQTLRCLRSHPGALKILLNGAGWRPKAPAPSESTAQRQDLRLLLWHLKHSQSAPARSKKAWRNPKEEKHFPPLVGFGAVS